MEKLINPGVGLHQNKVEECLKKMVVSERSTNVQESSKTSAVISSFSSNTRKTSSKMAHASTGSGGGPTLFLSMPYCIGQKSCGHGHYWWG